MKTHLNRLVLIGILLCCSPATRADPVSDAGLELAREKVAQLKRQMASSNPSPGDSQDLGFAPGSLKIANRQACSQYTQLFDAYEQYISKLEARLKLDPSIKKPEP
jgi:hypothetical protein